MRCRWHLFSNKVLGDAGIHGCDTDVGRRPAIGITGHIRDSARLQHRTPAGTHPCVKISRVVTLKLATSLFRSSRRLVRKEGEDNVLALGNLHAVKEGQAFGAVNVERVLLIVDLQARKVLDIVHGLHVCLPQIVRL